MPLSHLKKNQEGPAETDFLNRVAANEERVAPVAPQPEIDSLRAALAAGGLSFQNLPVFKRVLLLQGPVGPFFRKFADLLESRGTHVTKVNFNAGDDWYYPAGDIIRYCGTSARWPQFLSGLLKRGNYDAIFLFGDCREIHVNAVATAKTRNIPYWVFEEGYFRPNYITLEKGGVNAHSLLCKYDIARLNLPIPAMLPKPGHFENPYWNMARQAFLYFLLLKLGKRRYPYYIHHKPATFKEALTWVRSSIRKFYYRYSEASLKRVILSPERSKRFFLAPLQVFNDAQLHAHSDWPDVGSYIEHVMQSFALHATDDDWLVFKHHPMDRGHVNYQTAINDLAMQLGLQGRIHYVHDAHLPSLLDHAKGVVTINSTVGLQAMFHRAPVIALGRAFYNQPELTFQDGLDAFWQSGWMHDQEYFKRYRKFTILATQINSSFYADKCVGLAQERRRSTSLASILKFRNWMSGA